MTINTFIVLYGILATILAFHLAYVFYEFRKHSPFIWGVCIMAFSFGIICFLTLIFASASWVHLYEYMSENVMAALRFGIFTSAIGCNVWMRHVLKAMKAGQND